MAGFSGSTGVPQKQMTDAIAQLTAVETISQSDFITLENGIKMERWDGAKKCGKIIQASFMISKTDGTSFGIYTPIGTITYPYRSLVQFIQPVSIASAITGAKLMNGNCYVAENGGIYVYTSAENANVVYVSTTYMTN